MAGVRLNLGCPLAEEAHAQDFRVHMHVGHEPGFVCAARDALTLPPANQLGMFLHEFGHLIGGPSQHDADTAILERLGVPILYDDRMMQYVEL